MVRASERKHPVQRRGGDGDLRCLGLVSPRSKGIADHAFVSADRRFDFGSKIVATGRLPAHAAAVDDPLDMTVPLRRSRRGGRARDRGRTRRHDNPGAGMTLGDSLVHPVLIVGTVSLDGRERIGDLVGQRASPRAIVDLFGSYGVTCWFARARAVWRFGVPWETHWLGRTG